MAKRAKKEETNEGGSAVRTNGYDKEKVASYTSRIENLHDDLATERGEFMARCKSIHADIKLVLDEAKDEGIPKKEFKKVIERRRLEHKIENIREDLEGDQQDNYDMLLSALGMLADSPLGAAALSKTGNGAAHERV